MASFHGRRGPGDTPELRCEQGQHTSASLRYWPGDTPELRCEQGSGVKVMGLGGPGDTPELRCEQGHQLITLPDGSLVGGSARRGQRHCGAVVQGQDHVSVRVFGGRELVRTGGLDGCLGLPRSLCRRWIVGEAWGPLNGPEMRPRGHKKVTNRSAPARIRRD